MSTAKTILITTFVSLGLLGVLAALATTAQPTAEEPATELYVDTLPPGAKIILPDRTELGSSPGLFEIDPDVRRIIVELDGHDPQGKDVTIRAGEITRLKLRLRKRSRQTGDGKPVFPTEPAEPDSVGRHLTEAAQRALSKKMQLQFDEAPLREVIEAFAETLGVNLMIDHRAIARAGVSMDTPVTILLRSEVSISSGLNLVLSPVGLTWTIRDRVLVITTPEESQRVAPPKLGEEDPGTKPQAGFAPRKLLTLGHGIQVLAAAFSPDGKSLAAGEADGVVTLWDAQTGRCDWARPLLSLDEQRALSADRRPGPPYWISAIAFSPDGKTLAVATLNGAVRLLDAKTAERKLVLNDPATSRRLRLSRTEEPEKDQPPAPPRAHATVRSLAFSPDGAVLATGGLDISASGVAPGTLKLWDAKTGELKRDLEGHWGQVLSVAFSPNGKLLASAGGAGVRLWDPQTGAVKSMLSSPRGDPFSIAFSPDGRLLAAGGIVHEHDDVTSGMLLVWNAGTGALQLHRPLPKAVTSVAFSSDGKTLAAAGSEKTVTLFDPQTGKPKHEIRPADSDGDFGGPFCVAFSPRGDLLAIGGRRANRGGFVQTWDLSGDTAAIPKPTFEVILKGEGRWPAGKVIDGGAERYGIQGPVYVFDPADPKLRTFVRSPASCPGLRITGLEFVNDDGHPRVDVGFAFEDGKLVGGALFELTALDQAGKVLDRQRALELRNRELPAEYLGPAGKIGGPDPPNRSGKAELRFRSVGLTDVGSYGLTVREADIPLAARLLEDPDEHVCACAAQALGQWGAAAEEHAPKLERLLNDPRKRVRSAAHQALQRIRTPADTS